LIQPFASTLLTKKQRLSNLSTRYLFRANKKHADVAGFLLPSFIA
jgi:hypothetical protein